jgi:hypothetical protein
MLELHYGFRLGICLALSMASLDCLSEPQQEIIVVEYHKTLHQDPWTICAYL